MTTECCVAVWVQVYSSITCIVTFVAQNVGFACHAMAQACAFCNGITSKSVRTSPRRLKVTLSDGYEEVLCICGACLRTCWKDQWKLEDLDVCGKTQLYQEFWYIAKDELWRILQKRLVSFNDARIVQELNFV